jgi:hypothetical protein
VDEERASIHPWPLMNHGYSVHLESTHIERRIAELTAMREALGRLGARRAAAATPVLPFGYRA